MYSESFLEDFDTLLPIRTVIKYFSLLSQAFHFFFIFYRWVVVWLAMTSAIVVRPRDRGSRNPLEIRQRIRSKSVSESVQNPLANPAVQENPLEIRQRIRLNTASESVWQSRGSRKTFTDSLTDFKRIS